MNGSFITLRLLFRGSRDGMTNDKFHELCDNQGPLLVIIKTNKDILIGAFCSISYNNSGGGFGYNVDPKVVVFSITRNKVYHRLNDTYNVRFSTTCSFNVGGSTINIKNN